MTLFDTHAHLQDPKFGDETETVIQRAREAGVAGIIVCGYDGPSNHAALAIAERSPIVFPAVGIHPHDAKDVATALLEEMEAQARLPQVAAIGEIGLDFYRDHSPHEVQRTVLDEQLAIAVRVGKPVSVHSRAAEDAIEPHLAAYSRARGWTPGQRPVGVMHCFGGTVDQARRYVELGFLVSLACVLTYPGNEEARTIARELPLESLVVETDSPYLPPQQLRGRRNEPANVVRAVEALAAVRQISVEEAAAATTANACRVFGVSVAAEVGAE